MDPIPGCRVRILVVDNDPDGTAWHAATYAAAELGLDLLYFSEPDRGISQARNRILENVRGDYLAFVDDDEVVSPGWIRNMLDTLVRFDADVVFGPVRRSLPVDAPRWARIHPCFNPPQITTGAKLALGGCGNVIIKSQFITDGRFKFDPEFSFTGGEDTDFFDRLARAGARMTWCADAVVMEHVPSERLTLKWVIRRAFRGGQCYARILKRRRTELSLVPRALRKLAQVLIVLPLSAVVAPISPTRAILVLTKCVGAIGELTTILSSRLSYEEYGPARYRADETAKS